MKGHMQDGKFHPHTQSKGVRKSRDQSAKSTGVKVERKARDEEAIAGKNKGNIIFDSKIGKNTLNGIPIHKGQTSMKEKEQLKFLESDNRKLHQIAVETQNKIDWRNMNRELSEIEEKMNALDQKELDGKISSKRYLVLHDQLEKQFTFVRWTKFGDLR